MKLATTGNLFNKVYWKIWALNLAPTLKCPYSEFFWSVFSPNAGKCEPEKLQIRTLFQAV